MNREKGCPGRNIKAAQEPPAVCGTIRCSQGKLEEDLRAETVKWQKKAQDLYENVSGDGEFLENIFAYIRDCQYFLEKGDLIRAFEDDDIGACGEEASEEALRMVPQVGHAQHESSPALAHALQDQ